MWTGRWRVLRRTWRTGGGGSVLKQLPLHRCNSMSGHSQAADLPVLHGPSGSAYGRVVQPGALSRSGWGLFRGAPGEQHYCWVVGHKGRW